MGSLMYIESIKREYAHANLETKLYLEANNSKSSSQTRMDTYKNSLHTLDILR